MEAADAEQGGTIAKALFQITSARHLVTGGAMHGQYAPSPSDTIFNCKGVDDDVERGNAASEKKHAGHGGSKQGTFMGVYLPVVASMWGVLIFIRFGVVVGYAGWVMALGFTALAAGVQVLTTLSLCAVMSNSRNYRGGTFGILKRNLGGEIAGVVGLLYYLGMTTLASVELLGSVQAIDYILSQSSTYPGDSMTGSTYWDQVVIGGPLLILLAAVRAIDVRFVHGATAFILIVVIFSYVFGFAGLFATIGDWRGTLGNAPAVTGLNAQVFLDNAFPNFALPNISREQLSDLYGVNAEMVDENQIENPAAVLSIIFPMFLGVFQGGNKAAELATPDRSILKGTTLAILTSFVVYAALFALLAAVAERDVLKVDFLLFSNLTWPTEYIGLVGTVLVGVGACVELLEIGPTVLQAVAEDGLYSFLQRLGLHKTRSNGQPVNAVVVSLLINFGLLFVTSRYFETLATVVTMLFLQAYLTMHCAVLINESQQHASWRPTFRYYHWSVALFGAIATVVLMFYIQWGMAFATLLAALLLMLLVRVVEEPRRKGLATRALIKGRALNFLLTDDMITNRAALGEARKRGKVAYSVKRRPGAPSAPAQAAPAPAPGTTPAGSEQNGHDAVDAVMYWEPQVLCLLDGVDGPADDGQQHLKLLHLAEQLCTRGVLPQLAMVATIAVASDNAASKQARSGLGLVGAAAARRDACETAKLRLFSLCMAANLRAFPHVSVAPAASAVGDAYLMLVQSVGLGELRPNLVLLSLQNARLAELVGHAVLADKAVLVLKDLAPLQYRHARQEPSARTPLEVVVEGGATRQDAQAPTPGASSAPAANDADEDPESDTESLDPADGPPGAQDNMEDLDGLYMNKRQRRRAARLVSRCGTIDVWWVAKQGGLPVLLARVLSANRVWHKCELRIMVIVEERKMDDAATAKVSLGVNQLLSTLRISASVEIIQVDPRTGDVLRDTCLDVEGDVRDTCLALNGPESAEGDLDSPNDVGDAPCIRRGSVRRLNVSQLFPAAALDAQVPRPATWAAAKALPNNAATLREEALERFNALLVAHSAATELVVVDLPLPSSVADVGEPAASAYAASLERMTRGLNRVLFVHGSGDRDLFADH